MESEKQGVVGSLMQEELEDSNMADNEKKPGEANKIGFLGCLSYILGNCIGAGIFIAPSVVTSSVGSVGLSVIIWVICGLVSLLGSIVYIELGTGITEPGCDYAYMCHVGWKSVAFAFMWVGVILSYPAAVAVQIVTFGHYIIDGISPLVKFGQPLEGILEWCLGILLLVTITWVNFHSLGKSVAIFQIVATAAKLTSMALIILGGAYFLFFKGVTDNFVHPMENSYFKVNDFIIGVNAGFYAYFGWDILNYSASEIRNPARNMPLSLVIGMCLVILLYTSIIIAYFVLLTPEEVINTDAIAALFSQKAFGAFSYAVPFMIAILICGTLNSNIFCASRYMFAAAREGHLPTFLSCINVKTGSPRAAVAAQGLLTALMTLFSVNRLIDYVAFVMIIQKLVGISSLLWIRYKKIPVNEDVVRVPLILSVLFFLLIAVITVVPVIFNFLTPLVGMSVTASGLLLYYLIVKTDRHIPWLHHIDEKLTNWTMKIMNCKTDLKAAEEPCIKITIRNLEDD